MAAKVRTRAFPVINPQHSADVGAGRWRIIKLRPAAMRALSVASTPTPWVREPDHRFADASSSAPAMPTQATPLGSGDRDGRPTLSPPESSGAPCKGDLAKMRTAHG